MKQEQIDRINTLPQITGGRTYRGGKKEQAMRAKPMLQCKKNLVAQLNNIDIESGRYRHKPLGEEYGNKKKLS